jgi:Bacteriophage Mu Gam like protein
VGTKTLQGSEALLYAEGEKEPLAVVNSFEAEIDYIEEDIGIPDGEGDKESAIDTKPKTIESLEDAARYAYGLSETRKEIEKIEAVAAKEIERWQEKIKEVETWRETALKPLREKVEYFSTLLTQYHMKEYYNAPNEKAQAKLKSIKLPYGVTLASREQQTKLEIADEAALLNYAKENGHVEVIEKPKWSEIKKQLKINEDGRVFDANGEEVPFVKAIPQERKFEVK